MNKQATLQLVQAPKAPKSKVTIKQILEHEIKSKRGHLIRTLSSLQKDLDLFTQRVLTDSTPTTAPNMHIFFSVHTLHAELRTLEDTLDALQKTETSD